MLQLPAWNVSVPGAGGGTGGTEGKSVCGKTVVYVAEEREFLVAGLKKASGLIRRIYPPMANYIFLEALPGLDRLLEDRGIAVRSCENYRQLRAGDYRIAVRSRRENEALLQVFTRRRQHGKKSDDSGDDVQCGEKHTDGGDPAGA